MNKDTFIWTEPLSASAQEVLDIAVVSTQNSLSSIASSSENFLPTASTAFGNHFDVGSLETLRQQWGTKNFSLFPAISILPAADIDGAKGAFSPTTNQIYIAQEYLNENDSNPQAIINLLLEAIGHFVDTKVNSNDTPGDEGAIFSLLAREEIIGDRQLEQLRGQNDLSTIILDDRVIQIEEISANSTAGINANSQNIASVDIEPNFTLEIVGSPAISQNNITLNSISIQAEAAEDCLDELQGLLSKLDSYLAGLQEDLTSAIPDLSLPIIGNPLLR